MLTSGKALYITTVVLCAAPGSFPVQLHPFRARTNCSTPLGCTVLLGCHSFSSPTVAATGQKCACVPKKMLFEVRSISLPYTGRNMRSKPRIHLDDAGCPEVPVVSVKMRVMPILSSCLLYPKVELEFLI